MTHPPAVETIAAAATVPTGGPAFLVGADRIVALLNRIIMTIASIGIVTACAILTYSVATRSLFHAPTYWQDEAAVFILVGVTFMTSAFVQSQRGHIGIEALATLLSPRVNRARQLLVDIASLVFCTFFAWKSWTLTHEAFVDGQVSNSMWGPPLSIPYALMASGMTLLCLQLLLQILGSLFGVRRP